MKTGDRKIREIERLLGDLRQQDFEEPEEFDDSHFVSAALKELEETILIANTNTTNTERYQCAQNTSNTLVGSVPAYLSKSANAQSQNDLLEKDIARLKEKLQNDPELHAVDEALKAYDVDSDFV